MKNKNVVKVDAAHIEAGIKKYRGVIEPHLQKLIQSAGLNYIPYKFNDGRFLLVLPNNIAAFLYADEQTVFDILSLAF